jgi:hypothetical protein
LDDIQARPEVLLREGSIFTAISISPDPSLRQHQDDHESEKKRRPPLDTVDESPEVSVHIY